MCRSEPQIPDASIETIASEVFGEKTTIEAVAENAQPSKPREEKASPLKDDPVLRAFEKHLGANIVESRNSK